MTKSITAIALMMMVSSASATEWLPLLDDPTPPVMYWNPDSYRQGSGEIWILIDYKEPFGPSVRSSKSLFRFDCVTRKQTIPLVLRFDGQMGQGNLIDYKALPGSLSVIPGSLMETLYALACSDIPLLKKELEKSAASGKES